MPCVYDSAFPKHLCSLLQLRYQQLGTLQGGMLESSCCPDVGVAPSLAPLSPCLGLGTGTHASPSSIEWFQRQSLPVWGPSEQGWDSKQLEEKAGLKGGVLGEWKSSVPWPMQHPHLGCISSLLSDPSGRSFISVQPESGMTNCPELSGTENGSSRMRDFEC